MGGQHTHCTWTAHALHCPPTTAGPGGWAHPGHCPTQQCGRGASAGASAPGTRPPMGPQSTRHLLHGKSYPRLEHVSRVLCVWSDSAQDAGWRTAQQPWRALGGSRRPACTRPPSIQGQLPAAPSTVPTRTRSHAHFSGTGHLLSRLEPSWGLGSAHPNTIKGFRANLLDLASEPGHRNGAAPSPVATWKGSAPGRQGPGGSPALTATETKGPHPIKPACLRLVAAPDKRT